MEQIDQGIWVLGSHFVVWGCRGSLRMTVLETPEGLVLYSPVAMTEDDVTALRRLGGVALIMAPNLYHHMYLRAAMAAFPGARVLVPEGLERKIGAVAGAEAMAPGRDMGLPAGLEACVFAGHDLKETLLFHRPTRTLITADMLYNYQPEHFAAEKAFFGAIGCYGAPKVAFYHRFAVRDKQAVRDLVATVLAWRPRRVIMSHGRIVEGEDAGDRFAEAWRRFG